ncbi:serine/threonine-protein kinase [Sphingomonas zeicaulis]|uniref:serine/threonine-protein kinase n=1 Tax=Sphingomonas zeicaulis TaxID=1632740 RepID=UPI003D1EB150
MTDPAIERAAIALFERMLDVDEVDRPGWLERETVGEPALRLRVLAMAAADRAAELRTGGAVDMVAEPPPPERVGAYRITGRIGGGGMGAVYRGERATGDFVHAVAIKLIKPGLLSERLVERFRRERQTMAQLSHPNIAQLYDGGETEAGAPYIIMELVDGLPLLQWADGQGASPAERLRLFRDICAAVGFAHRNLIVHRDLTPSNILVTRDGTAKLIDFGIAKPADDDAAPQPVSGPSISSLSLTPGYAAPERMTSARVTTAADVYSLGKLLAKLLPPDMRDADLDAIVARATAERQEDRYPTAEALGEDVARWAGGFPVIAVGGGRRYRFRRFLGRHRFGVAMATLALVALVAALGLTADAYRRAEAARVAEAQRFEQLRSLARYVISELDGRLRRVVGSNAARVDLAARAQSYLSVLADTPGASPTLRLEAAQGLVTLAGLQGVPTEPNLGQVAQARANLTRAIAMLRAPGLPQPAAAVSLSEALAYYAMVKAHSDSDTGVGGAVAGEAERILDAVPTSSRDGSWHAARSRLRRAQLELAILAQDPDLVLRRADRLERDIGSWPNNMRKGRAAAFDRAAASHYRALAAYFTEDLAKGLAFIRDAEQRLTRLEAAEPNDPMVLQLIAFNAYFGFGIASGLPAEQREAERLVAAASASVDQLLRIEPNDRTLRALATTVRSARAQMLSSQGKHQDAVALQRGVVSLYEQMLRDDPRVSTQNRLVTAQFTLLRVALAAGDRQLVCDSATSGLAALRRLAARGALNGNNEAHRPTLEAVVAACSGGMPVTRMRDTI